MYSLSLLADTFLQGSTLGGKAQAKADTALHSPTYATVHLFLFLLKNWG